MFNRLTDGPYKTRVQKDGRGILLCKSKLHKSLLHKEVC